MRLIPRISPLLLAMSLTATTLYAQQQPRLVHAQLTTLAEVHDPALQIEAAKKTNTTSWVAWPVKTLETFNSGWSNDQTVYLEGDHHDQSDGFRKQDGTDFAFILIRISEGAVSKIHVESPRRTIDAGDTRVVYLPNATADLSVRFFLGLAQEATQKRLRDTSVFALSLHDDPAGLAALAALTRPDKDAFLREKSAFWLANRHGHEGFLVLQKLAHDEPDANLREKITFDFSICKDPGATGELIKMAHNDPEPKVRKQAQFWMATKASKVVSAELVDSAENDSNSDVRKSAVFALSRLPGDEAATQLIHVADTSKDPAVRKQAVFWLGQSHDPRALDYLTKIIQR
jgi:hypothetical protein